MMTKQKRKNSKKFAITEVILLIASIFAFSYILGSSIPVVKAQGSETDLSSFSKIPLKTPIKVSSATIANAAGISGTGALSTETAELQDLLKSQTGYIGKFLMNIGINFNVAWGVDAIISSAAYAAAAYVAVKWISQKLGASSGQAKALAAGAATTTFIAVSGNQLAQLIAGGTIPGLGWIAAGIGILITLFSWKDESREMVVFTCGLWQPQAGGKNCEKCNSGLFPCTEYQCASLGASCKIVNKGTKEQRCVWFDRNDVDPPIISPWEEALTAGYSYKNNKVISPPDRGFNVSYLKSTDGCVPAYTPFTFGVKTDKNAKCSVDLDRKKNFSSMIYPLSEGQYLQEHLIELRIPSSQDLEKEGLIPIGKIGDSHKMYVRCMSNNGVESKMSLEFSYCIQSGPDLNPPQIVETSIANNSPVSFGTSSVDLTVSVDKPAQCKWSTLDRTYSDMDNSMSCATKATQYNPRMLYDCKTTLTGIKDRVNNDFYFRCNGTYNGITNPSSYHFRLIGTEPLVITKVGPNETIRDSTEPVKVTLTAETASGAEDGKAICSFRDAGSEEDYVTFYNTNSYTHSQELNLYGGSYNYSIRCIDSGGNADTKFTGFKVEIDKTPPAVVRAFHDGSSLKIITNEESECVYDSTGCDYNFDDGIKMTTDDNQKEHTTEWNTLIDFHIKCRDQYGNEPAFNVCSIEAKPLNL